MHWKKKLKSSLAPPPAEDYVLGNDTAIGILIRNLVDNAIRYTPPHGEVKVSIIDTGTKIISVFQTQEAVSCRIKRKSL